MGYGYPDVYYQPEEFRLTPIAEIDYSDGGYQFDLRVVWKHEDGTFFTQRDSGCSCPSPFEWAGSLEKLDELDFDALSEEVRSEIDSEWSYVSESEGVIFLEKVRQALERV